MSGLSSDARRDLPLALVAAGTTWLTMLSWRGFSTLWGEYLGPLLLVAVVVATSGVVLRAAPIPRRVALSLHVLVVVVLVWLLLGGSVFHPIGSAHTISERLDNAWTSAEAYHPPIPDNVASIAPLLIPSGAAALLVVDILACWLRRVPLAGLPLLAVYCVPISVIGHGVSWVVFLFAAAGFLLMMFLHESAHITRWGRPLGGTGTTEDPQGFGVRTGASKTSATTVGSAAVVLAVIVPLFIPTLRLDGLGLFGPGGSGDNVQVINPITSMRRDLHRGDNVALLDVHTNDPDPSYMRIGVLTQFNGVEWTSGNREIVSNQTASGLVPLETGLSAPTQPYQYQVTATEAFDSTWLPTMFPVSSIFAPGSWHYDDSTMDFIATNGTNARGLSWTMTAAKPELSAYSMLHSLTAPLSIQEPYTALPSSLPSSVKALAEKVTQGADSRFAAAVMLQRWFRSTGGFRYSLKSAPASGSSNAALLQFLGTGPGSRVGYCEQFASAYAVMARTLEIPARVAVGFLSPKKVGPDSYLYSAHQMHAWPELYFRGSGWVRFEPTPAAHGTTAPQYTSGSVHKPSNAAPSNRAGGSVPTDPASASSTRIHDKLPNTTSSSSQSHVPWSAILTTLGVLLALALLGLVPSLVRQARRRRRLEGRAEDAWAELRDSAIDLGVSWPVSRSPHETGVQLAAWFGPEPDGAPLVRPPRGRGLAPGAEDALDRIVLTLELVRYARTADDIPGALAADVQTCIQALEWGSTRGALRRARWLPRSVIGGGRKVALADVPTSEAVSPGGVVDHVG
ncbi:MAG: transglutaminase domain-containing protein [Nocardioides sp.]|nr:transglutaminase domain-containing protein [Nocardioides sp.]